MSQIGSSPPKHVTVLRTSCQLCVWQTSTTWTKVATDTDSFSHLVFKSSSLNQNSLRGRCLAEEGLDDQRQLVLHDEQVAGHGCSGGQTQDDHVLLRPDWAPDLSYLRCCGALWPRQLWFFLDDRKLSARAARKLEYLRRRGTEAVRLRAERDGDRWR